MTSRVRDTRSRGKLCSLATSSLCVVLLTGCVSAEAPNSSTFGLSPLKPATNVAAAENVSTAENQPTIATLIAGVPKQRPGTVENPAPTQLALASTAVPTAAAKATSTAVAAQPVETTGSTATNIEQSATTQLTNTAVEEPKPSSFLGRLFGKRKQSIKVQPAPTQIALATESAQPQTVAAISASSIVVTQPVETSSSTATNIEQSATTQLTNTAVEEPKPSSFLGRLFGKRKQAKEIQPTTSQIALVTNSDQPETAVTATDIATIPVQPTTTPKPADIAISVDTPVNNFAAVSPASATPKKTRLFRLHILRSKEKPDCSQKAQSPNSHRP